MASRAFGTGSYGTGRYGVGSGTNYEVAAQSQIAFAVTVKPTGIYAAGGLTGISFAPQAFAARLWSPAAATQILFAVKWTNPQRVVRALGQTQIAFSVQGELVATWTLEGPCEAGTWQQDLPPWLERQAA